MRSAMSKPIISKTPIESTQSVSSARLGTTRSYTVMENMGMASANTLISKAANRLSR